MEMGYQRSLIYEQPCDELDLCIYSRVMTPLWRRHAVALRRDTNMAAVK